MSERRKEIALLKRIARINFSNIDLFLNALGTTDLSLPNLGITSDKSTAPVDLIADFRLFGAIYFLLIQFY